jgi:amino acid transporter
VSVFEFILGPRLANRKYATRKIGALEAIPAMGLDGLGSSAYGPEAALTILAPLGVAGLSYIGWIMAAIVALLAVLFASYRQTIRAYPNNGGAYIVSKENLGTNWSLLAAAALMIDYVLNVAVGISAGVGALVSAAPGLQPHILPLCLGILLVITLMNLRGTIDAGRIFALPTYVFIVSFLILLGIGLYKAILSGGHPQPIVPPFEMPAASGAVSLWLLARAFASGCTAMTGVEAVSNGMSAFRDPPVKHGHQTLSAIVLVLGVLLAGIAYLAWAYGIGAMDQEQEGYRSVLSQLASAIIGQGIFYYVAIGSLLCVLTLSANTSFVDFPRLCRMVAADGFLPKPFAFAGRRLVFSIGILYLAATAGLLLIAFGGVTDRLIPLFAIGAFTTFTLSQIGMMFHCRGASRMARSRHEAHAAKIHFSINTIGALTTAAALIVIILTKFTEGAWITIVVIPCVIALLKTIRGYYDRIAAELRDPKPLDTRDIEPPIVLVMAQGWNRLTDKALGLAMSLTSDVIAVHLTQLAGPEAEEYDRSLRAQWHSKVDEPARLAGLTAPRLMVLQAQYRDIHEPLLRLASELEERFGHRRISVLIPEVVKRHWYQHLLHAHRARYLQTRLLRHAPRLTVINVPWHMEEASE